MRWFSRTYHTPLTEVEKLPIEYLLQHYYENYYTELEPEDLDKERTLLIETKAEKTERLRKEAEDELATQAFMQQQETAEKQKASKSETPLSNPVTRSKLPEPSLDNPGVLAPRIDYKFVSDQDMENLIQSIDHTNLIKGTKK